MTQTFGFSSGFRRSQGRENAEGRKWLDSVVRNCLMADVNLQSVEWRRQCRIDTLVEDFRPPEVLRKFYAAGRVGSDKRGNPRKHQT